MEHRSTEQTYGRVQDSFGPNASLYTASQGHADQAVLARLVRRVNPTATDYMLDIGTGAGHTALAFAPWVARVVAYDLTPQMLQEVQRNAARRGVSHVLTQRGAAENLPFVDNSFDVVTCRLTAHHFADLAKAVREMGRVLKPNGRLAIVDTIVPEDPELDRQINQIEMLRDPSHVRNYRPMEWRDLLKLEAGLTVTFMELDYYDEGRRMDFDQWTTRIGTWPENIQRLRQLFRSAGPQLADVLKIELDGDHIAFALPIVTLIAEYGAIRLVC